MKGTLSITKAHGRTYYGHSGGYPGHITMSKLDLERRLSISVLTNSNDGPAAVLCGANLHLIDLALSEKGKTEPRKPKELEKFEGRFASLWGLSDVVNLGGRLYALAPTLPGPAAEATELKVVTDTALKVVGDKGFGRYHETMLYTFRNDGRVKQIRGSGGSGLVPAEEFRLPEKVLRPSR